MYTQVEVISIIEDILSYQQLTKIKNQSTDTTVSSIAIKNICDIELADLTELLEQNDTADIDIDTVINKLAYRFSEFKLPRVTTIVEHDIASILTARADLIVPFFTTTRSWIILLAVIEILIDKVLKGASFEHSLFASLRKISFLVPDDFTIY